ncbi:MAG: polysaccharide deacetylase family protein [Akkermansiaceae bacterium]|nr:polysaccharide deacetylase family protein [Armatimonadota bacterium]
MSRSRFTALILTVLVSISLVVSGCDTMRKLIAKPTPVVSPVSVVASPAPSASPDPVSLLSAEFDKTVYAPMNGRSLATRIPVIMYHDIIKKRGRGSVWFDITEREFIEQMDWIAEQGATPISLEQLHRHLTRGEEVPEKSVVLTFDDNYQGFNDIAYPILKERQYPSAMFVHTNFVGDKTGAHPKMDWETLKALDADPLVTIASHTLSHPTDMAKQPIEEQERELTESKALLEAELGHPVPYFAYPNGTGDKATFEAAERAGYTMAFTIVNGPAEESPDIMTVNRYIHTRLKTAFEDCEKATENAPAAVVDVTLTTTNSVRLKVQEFDGVKLGVVYGGKPQTFRGLESRQSVGEFVEQAGGVAGMNGTFFADAALRGTNNVLIGPSKASNDTEFYPEAFASHLPKLKNRPLVIIGKDAIVFVPFQPGWMNNEEAVQAILPDYTDTFLGGAWIVHNGEPRTRKQMQAYAATDFNDPRRRACFGVTADGEVALVGSLEVISTEALARAAAEAGLVEAVLVDSGFSTSIVFDSKIIVTGHTAANLPSRPVPHGIVIMGLPETPGDEETMQAFIDAQESVGEITAAQAQAEAPGPRRGKRRRR